MLHAFKQTAVSWELRRAKKLLYGNSNEQLAERQFYASIIPQGRGSILDVGANAGTKTEIFRHFAERVVAIEPDPTSAETLRRRFRWRLGVTVRQCAITSASGSILFYQFAPGSAFNAADTAWAKSMVDGSNHMCLRLPQPKEMRVRAHTIAEIEVEFRPIKYLKVDAEGHEEKVISTLSKPVPLISLEFNFPQMHDALAGCVTRIEALGNYRFNAAISEPPVKWEFTTWLSGAEVIGAINSSGWRYSELFALLNTDSAP
jgi:FkbM family methyltransferase